MAMVAWVRPMSVPPTAHVAQLTERGGARSKPGFSARSSYPNHDNIGVSIDGLQSTGARIRNPPRTASGGKRRRFRETFASFGITTLLSAIALTALMIDTRSEAATGHTVDQQAISYVREQLRPQGAPASAFAVVSNGTITESGALGDGVGIETPFLLGSLSKSFTALAVMQLVDTGRVELDEPVTLYIPWFRTADPTALITVRQLLDQTSGLPTWAGTVDLSKPDTTLEQRVRAVADVMPISTPGASFTTATRTTRLSQMHSGQIADDAGSRYAFGWRDSTIQGRRVIQHEGDLSDFHSHLGMLPETGRSLIVLTAHNSQLFNTSAPYEGGLQILAGGPQPEIDNSYRTAGAATSVLGIVEAAVLAAGTISLARRIRRMPSDQRPWRRRIGAPALGYLTASVGGTTLIYVGLKTALRKELQVTPNILFAALPDVSTMLSVAMGWLGLAGVITLIAGTARSRTSST